MTSETKQLLAENNAMQQCIKKLEELNLRVSKDLETMISRAETAERKVELVESWFNSDKRYPDINRSKSPDINIKEFDKSEI